jgi:hypothetical protein
MTIASAYVLVSLGTVSRAYSTSDIVHPPPSLPLFSHGMYVAVACYRRKSPDVPTGWQVRDAALPFVGGLFIAARCLSDTAVDHRAIEYLHSSSHGSDEVIIQLIIQSSCTATMLFFQCSDWHVAG